MFLINDDSSRQQSTTVLPSAPLLLLCCFYSVTEQFIFYFVASTPSLSSCFCFRCLYYYLVVIVLIRDMFSMCMLYFLDAHDGWYVGLGVAFQEHGGVQVTEERMVWLETDMLPLYTWSGKAFKKVDSLWGEVVFMDDDIDEILFTGRVCVKTNIMDHISHHGWVDMVELVNGKLLVGGDKAFVGSDNCKIKMVNGDKLVKGNQGHPHQLSQLQLELKRKVALLPEV
ncbi:hypothetical protein L1887_30965 [Cichorium endivia]|nr:hypothetical protein L1887_30965 [Cichorium endivia]